MGNIKSRNESEEEREQREYDEFVEKRQKNFEKTIQKRLSSFVTYYSFNKELELMSICQMEYIPNPKFTPKHCLKFLSTIEELYIDIDGTKLFPDPYFRQNVKSDLPILNS